jgi:hypothetical protein
MMWKLMRGLAERKEKISLKQKAGLAKRKGQGPRAAAHCVSVSVEFNMVAQNRAASSAGVVCAGGEQGRADDPARLVACQAPQLLEPEPTHGDLWGGG